SANHLPFPLLSYRIGDKPPFPSLTSDERERPLLVRRPILWISGKNFPFGRFLSSQSSGELMTIHRNVPDAPRISLFLTRKTLALPSLQALPFGITIAFWPLE